jgi:hypothetical protein
MTIARQICNSRSSVPQVLRAIRVKAGVRLVPIMYMQDYNLPRILKSVRDLNIYYTSPLWFEVHQVKIPTVLQVAGQRMRE